MGFITNSGLYNHHNKLSFIDILHLVWGFLWISPATFDDAGGYPWLSPLPPAVLPVIRWFMVTTIQSYPSNWCWPVWSLSFFPFLMGKYGKSAMIRYLIVMDPCSKQSSGWWFQPLWKLLVKWDKIHVPNHQPVMIDYHLLGNLKS